MHIPGGQAISRNTHAFSGDHPKVGIIFRFEQRPHVIGARHALAVTGFGIQHPKLDEVVHGIAPTHITKGSPEDRKHFSTQFVDILVHQGVAVGVGFVIAGTWNIQQTHVTEQALWFHFDNVIVAPVRRTVAAGHQNTTGCPGKFVSKRIVHCFGSRQPTAIGTKVTNFATPVVNVVNDTHGGHMVNAGIQADLIEEDQAFLFGLGIHGHHFVGHIGGGHQVFPCIRTVTSHHWMKSVGHQTDHQVVFRHQLAQLGLVVEIESHGLAVGVAPNKFDGIFNDQAGHCQFELTFKQVTNEWTGHHTGTQHKYFFHSIPLPK